MARKHPLLFAVLASCCSLWLWAGDARAQEQIAVIVSSSEPGITFDLATLRGIYLKKIYLSAQGQSLIPVNLPPAHPLRQAFSGSIFHMSDAQLRSYWNRRYFQGISPPYVLGSQQAVVRFVASTPGAIGYVLPCHLEPGVHQVLLLTLPFPIAGGEDMQCPPAPSS